MARELEGKIAAVTGAASGIGLASAEAMLAAGALPQARRRGDSAGHRPARSQGLRHAAAAAAS